MKTTLISILLSSLKLLLTLKKICLLIGFIITTLYIKTKIFKNRPKTIPKFITEITPTERSSFPKESKRELFLVLSQTYHLPTELIERIFFIPESAIARKNLLFLSFYQDGFISHGDGIILESNPPQFPYIQEVPLKNDFLAQFLPTNPYIKKSKDRIYLVNKTNNEHLAIDQQLEDMYIRQIFEKIIEIIPHLQYTNFEECTLINEVCFGTRNCDSIDTVRTLSERLLQIKSEQLRLMLFEQLQIAAYRFWYVLAWNNTQKTAGTLLKTNKILVHSHFFYWHINEIFNFDDFDDDDHKFYRILTQNKKYIYKTKKVLGEQGDLFWISSDYDHNHIRYPHPFFMIEKKMEPLKMH